MSNVAALPDNIAQSDSGILLTFIVPAPDGCNLGCAFCFIDQRAERTTLELLCSSDYARFIKEVQNSEPIEALCIQGHEPLLPASLPYTMEILDVGNCFGIPVSIVTNGTFLGPSINDLAVRSPARITVSIDADSAEAHDRQRRKDGAFASAILGLRQAVQRLPASTELVVASVLMPKRHGQLVRLPRLLSDIGIKRWVVTALQKVGREKIGGPVADHQRLFRELAILKHHANTYDIDFVVDDEFGALNEANANLDMVGINALRIRRLVNPTGVFRLMPDGRCSMGTEILKEVDDTAPIWLPGAIPANDFLNLMRSRSA